MRVLIGKTPFFRLLIPVIIGIAACSFFPKIVLLTPITGLAGLSLMLFSYRINEYNFRFRWLFGAGAFLFLFALSLHQYDEQEQQSRFTFSNGEQSYLGIVQDIPEVKPRSIAINIKTAPPTVKKIILYLEKTDDAMSLKPGDEIVFATQLQPFRNFGNPDDFDYPRFMKIKGFAGFGFVTAGSWCATGRKSFSIPILSQNLRAKALDFYLRFNLDRDAYALLSAITLGYKAYLTGDMKEAFRASGTSHVLAVSGLHVGIIYIIINTMFAFLGKTGKSFIIRQWLVILLLWGYAFIAGMSASVIRAAIMLTIYCLGRISKGRGFTYNTLAAAAFLILIFRPFFIFDISFQMSFGAVFAILYFNPKINSLYRPANRVAIYVWELLTVSVSAQLGVFPLVLYYFGTFPTYFFITNILVIPMIGLIIYGTLPLAAMGTLNFLQSDILEHSYNFFQWIVKRLAGATLKIVYISESIPFAQISDIHITLFQLIVLTFIIFTFTQFLYSKRSGNLIISLSAILLFQLTITHNILSIPSPKIVVFNHYSKSDIAVVVKNRRIFMEVPHNGLLPHPEKRILRISDDYFDNYIGRERFNTDILILSQKRYFNIEQMHNIFNPSTIVLDSSLPRFAAKKMEMECIRLGIKVHDVAQNGAFSVNF